MHEIGDAPHVRLLNRMLPSGMVWWLWPVSWIQWWC